MALDGEESFWCARRIISMGEQSVAEEVVHFINLPSTIYQNTGRHLTLKRQMNDIMNNVARFPFVCGESMFK